jgi:hypothetical protein
VNIGMLLCNVSSIEYKRLGKCKIVSGSIIFKEMLLLYIASMKRELERNFVKKNHSSQI